MKYPFKEKQELTDWHRFYILFPRVVNNTTRDGKRYLVCCEPGWRRGKYIEGIDYDYASSHGYWEWEYSL